MKNRFSTRLWLAWMVLRGVYTQATWNGEDTVITFTDIRAWKRITEEA
jgi:hypothetical protein